MNKIFIRNFIIFLVALMICVSSLITFLIMAEKRLDRSDVLIEQTHEIITEGEQLLRFTESMLAAQRGYIITSDESFLNDYEKYKQNVSKHIAQLSELTDSLPEQNSRIDEIRGYFVTFSAALEKRAAEITPKSDLGLMQDIDYINNLRANLLRLNSALLDREYQRLETRINLLENYKNEYLVVLLSSIITGTVLILVFNWFLLRAQRKRSTIEKSLKTSEERFILAVDGTQDGIFDWDLESGKVFYSKRFFTMLGYDDKPSNGTTADFTDLLHPEDKDQVWEYINQYLMGTLSEYEQDFRLKGASGRWIWIKSRAKALYDKDGNAVRIVGAHTDITPMKKEQEKLTAKVQEAEGQNKAKSEFLAHMSHEIRTPLTAITGIAEILNRQKDKFDEKQAHLIKTLGSSTSSLKELINDILDFSKIENGEIELNEHDFDLQIIFEETISMMALKAGEKNISFVFDYNNIKDEQFYGDGARIRQILVNLVGNAIKFTDKGGVAIKADFEDRGGETFLRVDVSDTGIGIEPENFDLVFEKFKQADSSVSRKYGGTGLGLPISYQLAKLMGGDIVLSSEYGKGSTFSLLLPLKISQNSKKADHSYKLNKKLNDQLSSTISNTSKVLIVEDYEGNIVVISYILDEIGLKYDVARNGREGVDLWNANHYDIVLMDVQMPEMDGFDATRTIRRNEEDNNLPHTPIIGMTAHALVGDKNKCIEVGMDSYLPKPLVENDLKSEILKFLKKNSKAA